MQGAADLAAMALIDLTGRVVKQETIKQTVSLDAVQSLDVGGIARGTYLLRCVDRAGRVSSAVVMLR